MSFTCDACGKTHAGATRDIRMGLPEPIFTLDEQERRARAYVEEDFAVLHGPDGDRHFVRALLELPIEDEPGYFGYGAWVEVVEADARTLIELWNDEEGDRAEPFPGRLANELRPYASTEGLAVRIRLRDVKLLPRVELEDGEHELVGAQRHGISAHHAHQLAATVA
ncbi:MAG: DUF2199 domain-containing protein [Actinobacteria bacterium]|nr:DUF2199 domain-containing protein [Actinomycetota bacterium]